MRELKIITSITNRQNEVFNKYLVEVARFDSITPDEEIYLTRMIREGDKRALKKMCEANLRFVISVAKQYQGNGLPLPDLINEGNYGLIKAAKRFDETKGFKFISYAVWWIRQAIMSALSEHSKIIRMPLNKVNDLVRVKKSIEKLEQLNCRYPTVEEVSEFLEIDVDKVKILMINLYPTQSLDAENSTDIDNDNTLMDNIENKDSIQPDHYLNEESRVNDVQRFLSILKPKEKNVIEMYYGIRQDRRFSNDEIGTKIGLNAETVRQIREKAMRKMRHSKKKEFLIKHL